MKSGKKEMKIEVYESLSKRKQKFLVTPHFYKKEEFEAFKKYAKHFFRCSSDHLVIKTAYVLNDELYFEKPSDKGCKLVCVAYYQKAV